MKSLFKISIGFNLIIIAGILYLLLFGKQYARDLFVKYIIEVRFEQKLAMFKACPETKGAIIFLGNSIIEGGNWDELFPGKTILNRGIGGDVTAGVLSRMDEITRHEPSKLFICIGTNDLAFGVATADIIANYKAIIEKVREASPATKIYVHSILPVGKKVLTPHKNHKIPPLNKEIQQMCAELGIPYIDIHARLSDAAGYLDSQYTNDNLHLLGSGYLVWKDYIEKYVNE